MENLPYVISAELDLSQNIGNQYINRDKLSAFREDLDADLRDAGKNTRWVEASTIAQYLNQAAEFSSLPVVSLDDRYLRNPDQYLGISRGVDDNLNDAGYVTRSGYAPIPEQLQKISTLGTEITLIDDVLYSGEMITWLRDSLAELGVTIKSVATGIAIEEGIDKLSRQGIDVSAATVFSAVDDELCERDLAVIPGSGRRIASQQMNALYFDSDNGRPEQWASIAPQAVNAFCLSSLERSIRLLRPQTRMQSIGTFRGYDSSGRAIDVLTKRIGELL